MKSTKSTLFFQLLLLVAIIALLASCSVSKPTMLKSGRYYTYHQIKAAGYKCAPFKGRHYITSTSDSSIANIFPIK